MPVDHSLDLRRGVVTHLNGDASIVALVDKVYAEAVPALPAWDFVQVGIMLPVPFEASCLDGAEISFAVYACAKGRDGGNVYTLNRLIVDRLDGARFNIGSSPGAHIVALDWQSSNTVRDTSEADAWRGINQFVAITADDF